MANVLREAVHVAWVAGQLKVDPRHTCAQGDDAACSCVSRRDKQLFKIVPVPLRHSYMCCASHCRTGVMLPQDNVGLSHVNPKMLSADKTWIQKLNKIGLCLHVREWMVSYVLSQYLPWERVAQLHIAWGHAAGSIPALQWSSQREWWTRPCPRSRPSFFLDLRAERKCHKANSETGDYCLDWLLRWKLNGMDKYRHHIMLWDKVNNAFIFYLVMKQEVITCILKWLYHYFSFRIVNQKKCDSII